MKTEGCGNGFLVIPLSFLLLFCQLVAGEVVAISYTGDGSYLLTIKNGQPTIVAAKCLDVSKPNPSPDPPPTPNPNPVLTDRAKAIQQLAATVDDPNRSVTCQKLSAIYLELAKQVTDGKITNPQSLEFAIKTATDMMLAESNNKNAWLPLRKKFMDQWSAVAQEGGALADYSKLLVEVSQGIGASVSMSARAIDLATILQIVQLILELIQKLKLQ